MATTIKFITLQFNETDNFCATTAVFNSLRELLPAYETNKIEQPGLLTSKQANSLIQNALMFGQQTNFATIKITQQIRPAIHIKLTHDTEQSVWQSGGPPDDGSTQHSVESTATTARVETSNDRTSRGLTDVAPTNLTLALIQLFLASRQLQRPVH